MTPVSPQIKLEHEDGSISLIDANQIKLSNRRHFNVSECLAEMNKDTIIIDDELRRVIPTHVGDDRNRVLVPQGAGLPHLVLDVGPRAYQDICRRSADTMAREHPRCCDCNAEIPPGRPGRKCASCRNKG